MITQTIQAAEREATAKKQAEEKPSFVDDSTKTVEQFAASYPPIAITATVAGTVVATAPLARTGYAAAALAIANPLATLAIAGAGTAAYFGADWISARLPTPLNRFVACVYNHRDVAVPLATTVVSIATGGTLSAGIGALSTVNALTGGKLGNIGTSAIASATGLVGGGAKRLRGLFGSANEATIAPNTNSNNEESHDARPPRPNQKHC